MNKSILDVSVEFIFELVLVSLCFRSDSSVSMFMCLRVFAGRFDVLSILIGVLVFSLNSGCNFFLPIKQLMMVHFVIYRKQMGCLKR